MRRSLRHRARKSKIGETEVDMTSLLDILVNILFFLLHNYNAAGFVESLPAQVTVPSSYTRQISTQGIMLVVSDNKIWIDNKEIFDFSQGSDDSYDQNGKKIKALYDHMKDLRYGIELEKKITYDKKTPAPMINLVADKTVSYDLIKKIMHTCGEAGFVQFKFVVTGEK